MSERRNLKWKFKIFELNEDDKNNLPKLMECSMMGHLYHEMHILEKKDLKSII